MPLSCCAERQGSSCMNTHPDFEELLRLLEEHGVDYMIVGGYAVAYHGYPRFTKNLDLFFDCADENVTRLRAALVAFAFAEKDLPREAFTTRGTVLTFGAAPARVDLINDIDGVAYDEARSGSVRGMYGKVGVTFIGREHLLRNKRSTPRIRDRADVEELTQPEDASGG